MLVVVVESIGCDRTFHANATSHTISIIIIITNHISHSLAESRPLNVPICWPAAAGAIPINRYIYIVFTFQSGTGNMMREQFAQMRRTVYGGGRQGNGNGRARNSSSRQSSGLRTNKPRAEGNESENKRNERAPRQRAVVMIMFLIFASVAGDTLCVLVMMFKHQTVYMYHVSHM